MKRNIFTITLVALVVVVTSSLAQAATYTVADRDSLLDVLSRLDITLQPRINDSIPRINGSIWEWFTIPRSSDITIRVPKGSPIVINCEYVFDKTDSRAYYSITPIYREDVEEVGPGDSVAFTDRELIENRSGETLTPELIRSLSTSGFDPEDAENLEFYFRYASGTEFQFESYHPFNLGEGHYDIIDIYKPTDEEIAEQIAEYQAALAAKQAQEREVGIRLAQPAGTDEDEELTSDDEEIELPEVWQPNFYRRGSWLIPTDEAWKERMAYIVRIIDRENGNYIMIDDTHDPIYDQLLAPEYGPNAHYVLRTKMSHWLEYSTIHEHVHRRDKLDDDIVTMRTTRLEVPQDLILVEENYKQGGWQRTEKIKRHKTYWVIARDLLVDGLVTGGGSLADRIALMALDTGHGTHTLKQEKIGLLGDYQPRQTFTFYCWADQLTVPTSEIAGLKIDVTTGNSYVIDDEPFRNEIDLRGHKGDAVRLATTNGKPIGQVTLWAKTDREIMEGLEGLARDLTPEEEVWLDRYFAQLDN